MQKKILVVDDDLRIRELLYELFSRKGYKVFSALGGKEAIELMAQEKLDLVILDIKMPLLDGIETLRRIRVFDTKTMIIMLTASDEAGLDKKARLSGANGFFRKELDLSLITKAVERILTEEKEASAAQPENILIVDDDLQICYLLKNFLIKKGFYVLTAASGEEALERIKTVRPLIVLLDINLPGMDGLMALKRIKEIDEKINVIIITGLGYEDIAEEAIIAGAYDYITKPLDLHYLEMCLLTKIFLLSV